MRDKAPLRLVQISDTHLSRWDGPLRRNFRALAHFVNTVLQPDLVINTGDVILSNPDAEDDYVMAKQLHRLFRAPVRLVPGNHDVGEAYDRTWWATTEERLARFRRFFGETPWLEWVGDVGLVGVNSQVFGTGLPEEHEQWRRLEEISDTVRGRTVVLFQHMSFWTEYSGSDGRRGGIAPADREHVLNILSGGRVWGVANGHVHRYRRTRQGNAFEVWAPATSFLVEPRESARLPFGLEQLGVVLYEFDHGDVRVTFQTTPGLEEVVSGGFEESGRMRAEIAAALAGVQRDGVMGRSTTPIMTPHTRRGTGTIVSTGIREVTQEEVERFWADGWVHLPGLLTGDLAGDLLRRAQALMGAEGDENELRTGFDFETSASSQPFRRPSASDPLFGEVTLSPQLGRNSALLLGRDCAQRFFDDSLLVKLPMSRRPDRGQSLDWHSDTNPTDRMWIFFWIALDHVRSAQGGVRYLTGSHKLGPLWRGGSCVPLEQAYELAPRLRSCPMSDSVTAAPGDAIAHCSSVVHCADANTGPAPRWVHRVTYFPADAVYMGLPSQTISERGIRPFDTMDHPDFPVVYRPAGGSGQPTSSLHVRRYHGG